MKISKIVIALLLCTAGYIKADLKPTFNIVNGQEVLELSSESKRKSVYGGFSKTCSALTLKLIDPKTTIVITSHQVSIPTQQEEAELGRLELNAQNEETKLIYDSAQLGKKYRLYFNKKLENGNLESINASKAITFTVDEENKKCDDASLKNHTEKSLNLVR